MKCLTITLLIVVLISLAGCIASPSTDTDTDSHDQVTTTTNTQEQDGNRPICVGLLNSASCNQIQASDARAGREIANALTANTACSSGVIIFLVVVAAAIAISASNRVE